MYAELSVGRIVEGKIKGINLTPSQLKDKWSGDKGFDECLKDIRKIHDFLGFNDFLQTIWFLSNFQRYAVNLPSSLENYITEYLTRFTVKAEEIKSKEAISNLVKHKYHSFIDNGPVK